jgi:hypothetical protein
MTMNLIKSLAVAGGLALVPSAYAQVFATTDGTVGTPGFSGAPFSVGSVFSVTGLGIDVTSLGAFSGFAPFGGGVDGSLTVTIFSELSGAVVGTTVVDSSSTFANGFYYTAVTPTFLPAGNYAISVSGYVSGSSDVFGYVPSAQAPTYSTENVVHGYDVFFGANNHNFFLGTEIVPAGDAVKAGSFGFTPVPEPETYAMVAGLGLIGFGLWRRRQSR